MKNIDIEAIKNTLEIHESKSEAIKIGYIKEYIQGDVLDYIYGNNKYNNLIFYGGTAMRFLLGLNRLSEDLDFIGKGFNEFEALGVDLKEYFNKQKSIEIDYKVQKFRITLKFRNFLEEFGMKYGNSTDLYLKVEISDHFDFCKGDKTMQYPIVYQNKSMIIKSLEKSTLFSTKLNAVLYRRRSKNNKQQNISIKGRDFYDLFRYLQKDIIPDVSCIEGVNDLDELKEKLNNIVNNTSFSDVIKDIKPFIEDDNLLEFIEKNGKEYILEKIEERK